MCVCVCLPDQQQDGGDFDRGLLLEAEFFESATVQGAFQDKGKEKARVHMAADSGTQPATEPGGRVHAHSANYSFCFCESAGPIRRSAEGLMPCVCMLGLCCIDAEVVAVPNDAA